MDDLSLSGLQNLDLFSVGLAVAGIGVLGFAIFFNNRRSITNRSFALLASAAILWSIVNYSSYQIHDPDISFWTLRFVMFFAVWFAFTVFRLLYVFPRETLELPRRPWFALFSAVGLTSIITLTPLVFSEIAEISPEGRILEIENGPGIFVFGAVVSFLNLGGVILLLKKVFILR